MAKITPINKKELESMPPNVGALGLDKKQLSRLKKVKADMLKKLKDMGADQPVYTDLVEDYLQLWETKEALLQDIKYRGVTLRTQTKDGTYKESKNPSITEVKTVNTQMLNILKLLGLTPEYTRDEPDEDI